jgi:hypothetical protein
MGLFEGFHKQRHTKESYFKPLSLSVLAVRPSRGVFTYLNVSQQSII